MKIKCVSCVRDVNLDHDSISSLQMLEQSTVGTGESRC
jgi:hypothetical protein